MTSLESGGDSTLSESAAEAVSAESITTHTQLHGPIEDLSLFEQSLLLAELSSLSYYDPGQIECSHREIGFTDAQFFDRDGARAWIFEKRMTVWWPVAAQNLMNGMTFERM